MPLNTKATLRECCSLKTLALLVLLVFSFGLLTISLRYLQQPLDIEYLRTSRYEYERARIIDRENSELFGNSVLWTQCEEKANERLRRLKWLEYATWNRNSTLKQMDGDYLLMRDEVPRSLVYKLLRLMPKGGALHIHDMALARTEYLVTLTYEPNLWVCVDVQGNYEKFQFSLNRPMIEDFVGANLTCNWHLMTEWRSGHGPKEVNDKLKMALTISASDKRQRMEKLKKIESLLSGLLTYVPIWRKYLTNSVKEFIQDGVLFMEIRSSLPSLYDLKGTKYSQIDAVAMWRNATRMLTFKNRDFIGAKLIYTPSRNVNDTMIDKCLGEAFLLQIIFKDYIAGVDFISDDRVHNSRPLKDLSSVLLKLQGTMDLYLSTDETNWFSRQSDDNIIDAYLMGSRRLTFSTGLLRHSYIVKKCQMSGVGIVINPISNQVLNDIGDLRNHPLSMFLSYNLPLIISSEYPSYWQADPLTHDYYMVFMKIAPKSADLKVLKQLVINSIVYSALSNREKIAALNSWKAQWNDWICYINNKL